MSRISIIMLGIVLSLLSMITVVGTVTNGSTLAQSTNTGTNIIVETEPQSSVAEGLKNRVETSWPWYLTRASGIVAAISFLLLMISGVSLLTGRMFSFLEPITAWASHRALGIVFGVAVILHVIPLYFDKFVPFDVVSILVPFASDYKTAEIFGIAVGSFYVALGVLSLYLVAAIILSSLLVIEKTPKLWKITHLMSYLAMLFVFVHALYLGTDLASGIWRWLWVVAGLAVLYASLMRLWRAKTV